MRRKIFVSAFDFFEKDRLSKINNYKDFNIDCYLSYLKTGVFKSEAELELEGDLIDIQKFIDYLRVNKLKVYV